MPPRPSRPKAAPKPEAGLWSRYDRSCLCASKDASSCERDSHEFRREGRTGSLLDPSHRSRSHSPQVYRCPPGRSRRTWSRSEVVQYEALIFIALDSGVRCVVRVVAKAFAPGVFGGMNGGMDPKAVTTPVFREAATYTKQYAGRPFSLARVACVYRALRAG